jgi:hypothetical protein
MIYKDKDKDYTNAMIAICLFLFFMFYGEPSIFDIIKFKLMVWAEM